MNGIRSVLKAPEVEVEEVLASEADGGVEFQWMAARKGKEESAVELESAAV